MSTDNEMNVCIFFVFRSHKSRGTFKTQSDIYDEAFCENI